MIPLQRASENLRAGKLVAFPTETVYGLGANAYDGEAVAQIYALKARPEFNPLIVHVPDAQAAMHESLWNPQAELLVRAFWPGPLTLVLPRAGNSRISLLASAGLPSIALRVPAHPLAQALLREAGVPLAAPSANRSGRVSPTLAAHVQEEFGDALMVLDGGACAVGLESTIIDISGEHPTLLRPGAITKAMLEETLGCAVARAAHDAAINAPGMLKSHYAPNLPVRLNATDVAPDEALLAFGAQVPPGTGRMLNLSPSGNLIEAAANLFAHLRALDNPASRAIAVMSIPEAGVGIAINDRLMRAAAR